MCQRRDDYYKAQQAYAEYADANKNVIRNSTEAESEYLQHEMKLAYQVYSQIAANLVGARIQDEQDKPVFVIIDSLTVLLVRLLKVNQKY